MATTGILTHTGDVRRGRPHPQQLQRQTLTTDIMRTMATGEERRGPQKPFLIPSQLLTQTLRLMLTMAIMAMVAGMLLTMATLGPTTMVTTGAKVRTSVKLGVIVPLE